MEELRSLVPPIAGETELSNLIRTYNWAQTSVGPISQWPVSLKTTVNTILQTTMPMVMFWGADGVMIYNEAYSKFAGARHPRLLGSKVEEGWPEIAAFNKNVLNVCLNGNNLSYRDMVLTLHRNDIPEDVWMDLNYSPIIGENGKPAGVLAIVVETTKRVLAEKKSDAVEEELKREQEHLRDMFKHAPSFIASTKGPNHVFEMTNSMYLQVVGRNRNLIGKTIEETFPEVRGQGFIELLDEVYRTGVPYKSDEAMVKLDRKGDGELEEVYVNFVYQPIKNNEGNIVGIFIQGNDITGVVKSKKLSQDQSTVLEMITGGATIREALDQLILSIEKQSLKGMKASILLLDEDGKRLLHGAAPSLPADYNAKIHGIEIGPGVGSCGTAAFTQKPVIVTNIATDPLWKNFKDLALSYGLQSCWSSPIFSVNDQKIIGTFALYYDVPHEPTESDKTIINFATRTAALVVDRKNAENALREREEHFRIIADNMQNLAWMLDGSGSRTWFNKQWYNYTSLTEAESKSNGWQSAIHPDFVSKVNEVITSGLSNKDPFELIYPVKNKSGEFRRFLTRIHPIKDTDQKITGWIGTQTDIEEQENMTDRLESLVEERTQELMRSNEDLQQFAHVASHDLKEPVRKIKTFLNILQKQHIASMDQKGKDYIMKLHSSVDRIKAMIEGVLHYATIDSTDDAVNEVDLNTVIENVQKDLELLIAAKHATILTEKMPLIKGVPILLHQLFYNLINNSLKFAKQEEPAKITFSYNVLDLHGTKTLQVILKDNGIGFDQSKNDVIFGTFKRLHSKDEYEGTGLGLALCKKIVLRHGGEIYADGRDGDGAQFTINLPFEPVNKPYTTVNFGNAPSAF